MKLIFWKRATLLLALSGLTTATILGQSIDPTVRIIPPSPNSASIGKYGDIPLNHSSGLPNLNIPLLTVKEGALTMPVSLNYNYSGYRPSELPGNVGKGWSMMAGGVVTRVVRGLPDELHGSGRLGYLYNSASITGLLNTDGTLNCVGQNCPSCFVNDYCDGEPDMFYFSFGNITGKFFFGEDGQPHIVSDRKLKITYTHIDTDSRIWNAVHDSIYSFTITDEEGNIYRFGDPTPDRDHIIVAQPIQNVEWSFSQSGVYQPTDFGYLTAVSAWLLQEVEDADGNKIKLTYTNDYRASNGFIADNRTRLTVLPFDSFEQWPGHYSAPYYPVINSVSSENFLTQISADGWKVNFDYDLSPGVLHTLKKVSLLQSNGNLIKQFSLNYSSSDMIAVLQSLTENAVTTGPAVSKIHTFAYYDFPAGSYYVRGLDYWGYYNGVNNSTLVPFPPYNANREPDFTYTVMGALKKITYPTGGSSSFEYEPNQYGYVRESPQEQGVTINKKTGGGIRIKRITDTDISGNPPVIKDYTYDLFSNSNVSSGVVSAPVNKFFFSFPVTTPSGDLQWLFGTPTPDVTHDWNVWKSDPFYSMSLTPVYYSNVRETIGNTVRTDYEFTSHQDYNDNLGKNYGLGDGQVGPYESYDFARSLPKSETYYKNGNPVYKKQISYSISVKYRARSLWRQILVSSAQGSFQFAKGVPVLSGLVLKTNETTTQYDGATPLTSVTDYEYDSNYYSLKKQTIYSSRSTVAVPSKTENSYTYPFDYTTGVYPQMVAKHIFAPVIEQKVTVDGSQSARKLTSYALFNGVQYKPSVIQTQTVTSNPLVTVTEISKYTAGGNVLEYKKNQQSYHSYKWAYNDQYPVAEAINAQANEFYTEDFENINNVSVSGGQGLAHTGTRYTTDAVVKWTKPNTRNYKISYWYKAIDGWKYSGEIAFNGPTYTMTGGTGYDDVSIYPADAQLSNYVYRPLIGMTASINTNRQTNYYEYDAFQRLMNIKDLNGNIIKNFCYNYQNQGTDCFNPPILYFNTEQYQAFSKNCGTQANGSNVTYKVPAGTYYSLVSVAEANQRAVAEITANGQSQADNDPTATCTVLQCYNYTLSANQGFSTTYQWKNCNGVVQSAHLDVGQSTSVCALDGTVSGGPFTKGAVCVQ